jgi:hypothetical protein
MLDTVKLTTQDAWSMADVPRSGGLLSHACAPHNLPHSLSRTPRHWSAGNA